MLQEMELFLRSKPRYNRLRQEFTPHFRSINCPWTFVMQGGLGKTRWHTAINYSDHHTWARWMEKFVRPGDHETRRIEIHLETSYLGEFVETQDGRPRRRRAKHHRFMRKHLRFDADWEDTALTKKYEKDVNRLTNALDEDWDEHDWGQYKRKEVQHALPTRLFLRNNGETTWDPENTAYGEPDVNYPYAGLGAEI